MRIELSEVRWKRAGKVLVVEGRALHPGTFTGIDGHTVRYPKRIFETPGRIVLAERRLKLTHRDSDDAVVGFITGYDVRPDGLYIRGYVFDEKAMEEIEKGTTGFSIEADVEVNSKGEAERVRITAVSLVRYPAAPMAGITNAHITALLSRNSENEAGGSMPKKDLVSFIEEELKKAGVAKDILETVMDVLKKALKTNYPAPVEMEAKLADLRRELEETVKERDELRAKLEALEKEYAAYREKVELERKIAEVRSIDPEFDPAKVISDGMTFEAKLAALDAYAKAVKARLEVVQKPSEEDKFAERVAEILRELGVGEH